MLGDNMMLELHSCSIFFSFLILVLFLEWTVKIESWGLCLRLIVSFEFVRVISLVLYIAPYSCLCG